MKLIECVPNFSEGRNKSKIDEIIASIKESSQTTIIDVDMGFDTNRTVITIIGSPSEVLNGVFNGIKKASKVIDMRKHTGTHPRIGSTDVCPQIPIKNVIIRMIIIKDLLLLLLVKINGKSKIVKRLNFWIIPPAINSSLRKPLKW